MTGYSENANRTANHPSFGSVDVQAAQRRQQRHSAVRQPARHERAAPSRATSASPIGRSRPTAPASATCAWPAASTPTAWTTARSLLASFDDVRRDIDATGTMKGMDSFTTRAFDMVASGTVRKALDLTREDPRTRDRYKGVEQFLTARRLVEAGVGCVTLSIGGWDTHSGNFKTLRRQLPRGRSRRRQPDPGPARSRHGQRRGHGDVGRVRPHAEDQQQRRAAAITGRRSCGALVAGGGLQDGPGDRLQPAPAASTRTTGAYTVPQVLSTLYQAVGIDPSKTFPNGSGRPMYILDDREVVKELV